MPQILRDPASYTDPNGFVYWQDGQVYRRIYAERADFFRTLLGAPVTASLQTSGKLVPTQVVPDPEDGLLLAHDTVWPRSYPQEWCAPMLKDAGRLILDVAAELAEAGYGLADGHPWNVLFHRGRPVFIDLGSIVEAHPALPWPALAQFQRFVLYPLHLHGGGMGELARARLQDLALGVSADLAVRALPAGYKLTRPGVAFKLKLNQAAERITTGAPGRAGAPAAPRTVDAQVLRQVRKPFFGGLRRELDAVPVGGSGGGWVSYYASCPSMGEADAAAKQQLMERLLSDLSPRTVLDLGSNTGQYAMMAARAGARVVAVDQDEASVAALYAKVRQGGLDVLPLVMDLGNPTPANGWCASQRPAALDRLRSDAAFMLALIHHLVFTGNVNFQQVAELAAKAAERVALIEWVSAEDPMSVYLRRTATKDFSFYTLENLVAALEAAGFAVEAQEPHSQTRRMLVCRKRG